MNEFILSLILIIFAGLFQGTFGLGMKKFLPLSWEAFWLIFSVVGMICIPIVWASFVIPDLCGAIFAVSAGKLTLAVILGAFWGIGAIMFGLAVNYVGMSIAYGISMGLAAAMGSLIPLIQIPDIGSHPAVPYILTGVSVMVGGVAIISYAGVIRDRLQAGGEKIAGIQQGKMFRIGILFAVINGIFAALLNVGFTQAMPAAQAAVLQGAIPRNASLAAWVVVLSGGAVINAGYAIYLLAKNRTFGTFSAVNAHRGYIWALITSVLWFAALGIYGQGAAIMGNLGPVIGWTMFLALSLVVSNAWGLGGGEWKNVPRPLRVLLLGDIVLIISWIILGYANSLITI